MRISWCHVPGVEAIDATRSGANQVKDQVFPCLLLEPHRKMRKTLRKANLELVNDPDTT